MQYRKEFGIVDGFVLTLFYEIFRKVTNFLDGDTLRNCKKLLNNLDKFILLTVSVRKEKMIKKFCVEIKLPVVSLDFLLFYRYF